MYAGGIADANLLTCGRLLHVAWRQVLYRIERLLPAPAPKHLRHNAERKRQEHPRPIHLIGQYMLDAAEVLTTIHPIENGSSQQYREDDFGRICEDCFRFHGCKDTVIRANIQILIEFLRDTALYANGYPTVIRIPHFVSGCG